MRFAGAVKDAQKEFDRLDAANSIELQTFFGDTRYQSIQSFLKLTAESLDKKMVEEFNEALVCVRDQAKQLSKLAYSAELGAEAKFQTVMKKLAVTLSKDIGEMTKAISKLTASFKAVGRDFEKEYPHDFWAANAFIRPPWEVPN